MERDIEKDLIEIECAIKSQKEKDNIFTMSVLQRCYKLVSQLKEYEDLEQQNKLLKLPCAVGDEFYCIWRNKGQNPIQKMQVKKIEIHERKGIVIQMEFVGNRGCLFRFYEDDFGKTVFLTGEEAEAALKELERSKEKIE